MSPWLQVQFQLWASCTSSLALLVYLKNSYHSILKSYEHNMIISAHIVQLLQE